jgi:membrane protease YdiL (CAAX protease family)
MHANAPIFLSLFVLALALTWLYEEAEGLLAPVMAHSLFNCANVVMLLLQEQSNRS